MDRAAVALEQSEEDDERIVEEGEEDLENTRVIEAAKLKGQSAGCFERRMRESLVDKDVRNSGQDRCNLPGPAVAHRSSHYRRN